MKDSSFALVTGASQGLGEVFARALAARGQNVILVARSRDKLDSLANELKRSHSILAEALVFDLASPSAAARIVRQLHHQNLRVNLRLNNSGVGIRVAYVTLPIATETDSL